MWVLLIGNIEHPQVFSKAETIIANHSACLLYVDWILFVFAWVNGAMRSINIEGLVISSNDIRDVRPFTLLKRWFLVWFCYIFSNCYRSYTESISSSWHQVCDYAFMSFAFVDLPELLSVIDFYSDSVLKNVLQMLFLVLVTLWEMDWVAPSNLDSSRSLCNMSENPFQLRIEVELILMVLRVLQSYFWCFRWYIIWNHVIIYITHGWCRLSEVTWIISAHLVLIRILICISFEWRRSLLIRSPSYFLVA